MYQTETIIALGSNLGNAIFNLRCAVRELENIVQRALVLCTENEICATDIVIDNNPLNIATNSLIDENTQQLAI